MKHLLTDLLLILLFVLVGLQPSWAKLDIVVPAYFYPSRNSAWHDLNDFADQADITAIMNPGNGPGNSQDSNYVAAVNSFRAAGGRVIGYVYSSYGSRPLSVVEADIDAYRDFYNIDGIFVDEMANTGPAQKLDYYQDIYNYVKSIDSNWEVMGNPGTTTLEQYLTWPTADRLVVFEGFGNSYPGYGPSSWNDEYDSSHFVHLIHSESAGNLEADLNLAVSRNAGGIYITNDVLSNPWDTLPSNWADEVAAVAQINGAFQGGDFNENGYVDAADLSRWTSGYGNIGVGHKDGDANKDGDVDGEDFLTWQRQWGQSSLTVPFQSSSLTIVPEPSTSLLPVFALLLIVFLKPYIIQGKQRCF